MAALRVSGWSPEALEEKVWIPHHTWAGDELYRLSIDLRGFYLKVGQFLGARVDFIPEPICRRLSLLQDKVRALSHCRTPWQTRRAVIESCCVEEGQHVQQQVIRKAEPLVDAENVHVLMNHTDW